MTACAQCSRELQPEWKFCIYCGAATGVPITEAIAIIRAEAFAATPEPGTTGLDPENGRHDLDGRDGLDGRDALDALDDGGWDDELDDGGWDDEPDTLTAPEVETAPGDTAEVLRAEDIPADEDAHLPVEVTAVTTPKVNILAILALILGCLVSPLAALFGHIALAQIGRTGERGTAIAWVAIVLGYLSLAALLVLGISYIVLNA